MKSHELRRIQAEACKSFHNPKRLLILEILGNQEISYMELLRLTGFEKVTLTQHVSLMRRKGIIRARRAGGNLLFSVSNPKIIQAMNIMRDVVLDRIREESDLLSVVATASKQKGDVQ